MKEKNDEKEKKNAGKWKRERIKKKPRKCELLNDWWWDCDGVEKKGRAYNGGGEGGDVREEGDWRAYDGGEEGEAVGGEREIE